jgi:hypothetical protein
MTLTTTKAAALLALCVSLGACEKVVSLDLPEGTKQLVVEARLERVKGAPTGAQRITLTTTDAYFSNSAQPPARGATVKVVNDAGQAVVFTESPTEPGVYVTNGLIAEVGRAYTLQIDYQNERYDATETLQAVAAIDSLYFTAQSGNFGPKEGLRATIDFRDPASVRNFYLWDQFIDGKRLLYPDTNFRVRVTAPDDGLDGRRIRNFQPYEAVPVKSGASVLVRQVALSETVYRYFVALSDQSSNDGSPFAVPLSSVRSNIANRTNPSHRPLGYFMAAEVAEARGTSP